LIRRFEGVRVDEELEIRLEQRKETPVKSPVLCGIRAVRE
jgi:hypothetical protein